MKCINHNIDSIYYYVVKVEEAVTPAPIEQTPPESYCAEKIRKYLPEDSFSY